MASRAAMKSTEIHNSALSSLTKINSKPLMNRLGYSNIQNNKQDNNGYVIVSSLSVPDFHAGR